MKRLLVVLLTMSMVLGSLAACASDDNQINSDATSQETTANESNEAAGEGEAKEPTTITVWSEDRHNLAYFEEKIAEFNADNPDKIIIDYVVQTDNYANMLTMSASSGQMPDIFQKVKAGEAQSFVDAGIIQPIDTFVDDEFKEITNYDDVMFRGLNVFNDRVYWVPTGKRSGVRLIYNKEIFNELDLEIPTDMDDMRATAKAITEAGEGKEFGIVVPGQSAPIVRMFLPIAQTSGILPYDYTTGTYNFDGYKPLMEAFKAIYEDGSVLPGAEGMKVDPARVQFSEGNVGFYGNASQEVGVLTSQFPAKEEWGAAAMPALDGEVKGALQSDPNLGWMMASSTENADAAWQVIKFFSSEEFLKGYVEAGLGLPLGDYMIDKVDLSKAGLLSEFSPLSYESVYPAIPEVAPEGLTWKDAIWQASVPGGADIDETIASLNKTYNEALDKAVSIGKVKRLVIKDFDPMTPQAGTPEYLEE